METFRAIIGPDNGDASPLQLCARAVLLSAFGIACVWIGGRRTFSHQSPLDIIVAIVVGSNISRAMTGKASFVGSVAATLLLVVLHRLLAMATLRHGVIARFVKGSPVPLVRDGKQDSEAMRRENISHEDLLEGLRMEKVGEIEAVKLAMLERGGKISVLPKSE